MSHKGIQAVSDASITRKEKAALLSQAAVSFQRDYYLLLREEMLAKWSNQRALEARPHLLPLLPTHLAAAWRSRFPKHNPLWEFTQAFGYWGTTVDEAVQKVVPKADYYLWPPLHRDLLCAQLLSYLTKPQPLQVQGLAVFLGREMLKTEVCIVDAGAWIATRFRIVFDHFIRLRIIHKIEFEAEQRAEGIKNLFVSCTPLRALYPEVSPMAEGWGTRSAWNLPGAVGPAWNRDPQIRAWGSGSVKQGPHYPITLVDDAEADEDEVSPASREETDRLVSSLRYSGKGIQSKTVLVGTFFSPFSTHVRIAKRALPGSVGIEDLHIDGEQLGETEGSGWIVVRLPAILDEKKSEERALYPTRQPLEWLRAQEQAAREESGGSALRFRMQRMLDFQEEERFTFSRDRWQEVSLEAPSATHQPIINACWDAPILVQADLAGKDESTKGKGDWNAIWAVSYPRVDGRVYRVLLDCRYDNTSTLDESAAIALDLAHNWGAWYVLAEESPSHKVVGSTIHRVSMERGNRFHFRLDKDRQTGNIRTLIPRGGASMAVAEISTWKMGRMRHFQLDWNAGLVLINAEILPDILEAFKMQVFPFPFIRPDDLLDSVSLADDERVASLTPAPRPKESKRPPPRREYLQIGRYTGLTVPKT